MANKIKLEKRDFSRAVLTDVLPYEVPFILTNEGFYKAAKEEIIRGNEILSEIFECENDFDTKPFTYKIAKSSDSDRKLYLVHPKIQLKVCNLYKDYNQLITYLCSRSSFSLRYPSKVAFAYYTKDKIQSTNPEEKFKDEGVGIDGIKEPEYASTFFEYKDVSFLYKFYDSYQFHRIEKKFDKLFKFDIAKCFDSFSTFQLSKSIRNLENFNSTKNLHSFELVFEKIMNNSNYGDTHGIVIGPEYSRVFSEILLQSIDVSIKKILKENEIFENSDYVIKRYVDDYFLFYNENKIKTEIYKTVVNELDKYKLYCNESKNLSFNVPFITGVTIAKQQYKNLLNDLFLNFDFLDENNTIKGIVSPMNRYYKISNQIITEIKCIVYNNEIPYSSITGYYFTLVRIKISEIDECINDFKNDVSQCDKITNFLLIIIELSFFVHAMDFRVRSTYLISQILIIINRISNVLGSSNSEIVKKKIYDESYLTIKTAIKKKTLRDIECLNLLIAIRDVDLNYQLSSDTLTKIIYSETGSSSNYFSLMTCLFYIQNKKDHLKLRGKVFRTIISKLSGSFTNIKNNSELLHIFLDSISCPYLTYKMKLEIARVALFWVKDLTEPKIEELVLIVSSRMWFIDWNASTSDSIERLLMKKELKSTY